MCSKLQVGDLFWSKAGSIIWCGMTSVGGDAMRCDDSGTDSPFLSIVQVMAIPGKSFLA